MTTNNHPAHGPVSLDRLHQISEILSKASAQSDGGNLGYAMADAVKVIDGAIARELVRREHAVWSQSTFGDVGPVGPLKHLSKEALEAAAEPGDLSEWADMQFLLWDAQRRSGISDEQITLAMIEKLAVNKQREWPEPKDGEPRMHIKEQPAPVVPTFDEWLEIRGNKPLGWVKDAMRESYDACRAAMLQAGNSPVIPDGWIKCSERMPEDEQEVLTRNRMGHCFVSFFDEHSGLFFDRVDVAAACCIEHILVTHWMPLPAAPQQDVRLALEIGMSRYAGAMQKLVDSGD